MNEIRIETKTTTKHNHPVVFGRKEADCPRCIELKAGYPARDGWQKRYFDTKNRQDAQRLEAIRSHDFAACTAKNVVCTHFDW